MLEEHYGREKQPPKNSVQKTAAGQERHGNHHGGTGYLGHRRRRLVVWLGAAGRQRFDRRDPSRRGIGNQLGGYGGGVRLRPLGGDGGARDQGYSGQGAALYFHQVRDGVRSGEAV